MMVLLTDGRANISLARSNEDPEALKEGAPRPSQDQLRDEVIDMAKKVGASGVQLLVIDTENKVGLLETEMVPLRPWLDRGWVLGGRGGASCMLLLIIDTENRVGPPGGRGGVPLEVVVGFLEVERGDGVRELI